MVATHNRSRKYAGMAMVLYCGERWFGSDMPVDLLQLPKPGERRLAVRVTSAAERALRQGHPWVFDRAITAISGEGRPGDLAVIFDDRRRFLAIGLYDPASPIRVRILQHGSPEAIDGAWLAARLAAAAGGP